VGGVGHLGSLRNQPSYYVDRPEATNTSEQQSKDAACVRKMRLRTVTR